MSSPAPQRPAQLDPLAEALLAGLQSCPACQHIVLGGYFALKHYCDYRLTHDVDAWWSEQSQETDREAVRAALKRVTEPLARQRNLTVNCRRFGDTESWELLREGTKIFSFQIARRTLQIEPYRVSPWPPIQIESLADNVASKMNALVHRGAPRDFADVHHLVTSGHVSAAECWDLWRRTNPDLNLDDARVEVARHLQQIELRRPLATVTDSAQRERAERTRAWFRSVFLPPASP